MDEKRRKKLIKLYDDICDEVHYPYNVEAYAESLANTYEKYIKSESKIEEITKWIKIFQAENKIVYLGVIEALRSGNYSYIDNALYTYINAFLTTKITLDSGYDHCISAWNLTPIVLCSNRFDILNRIYPKECGLSKNGMAFLVTATNLVMYLYYKNDDWKENVIKNTEKYLLKKDSMENKAVAAALYALMKKDFEGFSTELDNICKGRKKSKEYGENKFSKEFSFYSLGLYNYARYLYPDDADKIVLPESDIFLIDYHNYQLENNYPKGAYIIPFENQLVSLKELLDADIPYVSLKKTGRAYVVDTEKYKEEILKDF